MLLFRFEQAAVRQLIYLLNLLLIPPLCLSLLGDLGPSSRCRRLMQLLQLIVESQGQLHIGRLVASRYLVLRRRLYAHPDQLLQHFGEAHATEQARLEGAAAQENVLAEYLEVVVLLDVRAGLLVLVAHAAAGVEVAVLVGAALDAPRQPLVQLALHVHVLGALVLKPALRGGPKAIYLHFAHLQGFRLHFIQPEYVLHDVEGVLQTLQAIGGSKREFF